MVFLHATPAPRRTRTRPQAGATTATPPSPLRARRRRRAARRSRAAHHPGRSGRGAARRVGQLCRDERRPDVQDAADDNSTSASADNAGAGGVLVPGAQLRSCNSPCCSPTWRSNSRSAAAPPPRACSRRRALAVCPVRDGASNELMPALTVVIQGVAPGDPAQALGCAAHVVGAAVEISMSSMAVAHALPDARWFVVTQAVAA